MAHRITLCVFCSAEVIHSKSISQSVSFLKTDEFWPYVQPTSWKRDPPLRTPPMCPACTRKIEEITKCHREIVQLEKRLELIRKKLDAVVKDVPGALHKTTGAHHRISISITDLELIRENKWLESVNITKSHPYHHHHASSKISGVNNVKRKRSFDEMMLSSDTGSGKENDTIFCSEDEVKKKTVKMDSSMRFVGSTTLKPSMETGPCSPQKARDLEGTKALCEEGNAANLEAPSEDFADQKLTKESTSVKSEHASSPEENDELEDTQLLIHLEESSLDGDSKSEHDAHQGIIAFPRRRPKKRTKHSVRICVICGVKLSLANLKRHMKSHVGNYAFQCPTCSVTFPSRLSFTLLSSTHRQSCPKVKVNINCEVCSEQIKYGLAFTHFNEHESQDQEKNFPCPMASCGMSFTWKQTLELHLGDHEIQAKKNPSTEIIHDCEICGESLPNSSKALREHIVSHVGDFAYQCPMESCRLMFASRYSERCNGHHLRSCKSNAPRTCEVCNEKFDDLKQLRGHLGRHETSEKNFTCPMPNCGGRFTYRQSVEFHLGLHSFRRRNLQSCMDCKTTKGYKKLTPVEMEAHLKDVHNVQEVLRCGYCPFVFQSQEDLIDHLPSHVKKNGVKCHLCSNSSSEDIFWCGKDLRKHFLEEHQIGRRHLCESCDFSSASFGALQGHQIKRHGAEGRRQIFACQICEDRPEFSNPHTLQGHSIALHGGEKFRCNFCSETFSTQNRWKKHEDHVHRGVERKKFPCPQCDMMLASKEGFKRHLATMHSTELHTCPESECGKSFKSKARLRHHTKIEHEGLRFVCDTCGRSFTEKKCLVIHQRIHTGERPFLCKLCGLRFRQEASLYTHSKAHERKGDKFIPKGTFDRTPKDQAAAE